VAEHVVSPPGGQRILVRVLLNAGLAGGEAERAITAPCFLDDHSEASQGLGGGQPYVEPEVWDSLADGADLTAKNGGPEANRVLLCQF